MQNNRSDIYYGYICTTDKTEKGTICSVVTINAAVANKKEDGTFEIVRTGEVLKPVTYNEINGKPIIPNEEKVFVSPVICFEDDRNFIDKNIIKKQLKITKTYILSHEDQIIIQARDLYNQRMFGKKRNEKPAKSRVRSR